jgi:restriction system protein
MIRERLANIDEIDNSIKQRLLDYFNYNPRLLLTSLNYLVHNRNISINELIGLIETPLKQSGLVDLYGNPLSKDSESVKQIENKIIVVNNSLIDKAYSDPDFIYKIKPYQFEELVAELLEKEGFKVNLTKKTHDGGKDIFIAQNNTLGNFLYYIECKQFAPTNHVGVKFVRELYGTISADRATAGLLVTTSYFSKEAKDFVENVQNQLSLKGYLELKNWIRDIYLKTNNGA